MSYVSLQARLAYAAGALVAVGIAGFYAGMWLLPKFFQAADESDGYEIFQLAIGVAFALGFSGALLGVTLPWRRRRRRSGRRRRISISAVVVVLMSLLFATRQHELIIDLLFAAWLAYTLAFTYVRYGVRDSSRTRLSSTLPE